MIPHRCVRDAALALLDEVFVGKPDGQDYTWIVEHDKGGLLDTLDSLTAEQASFKPTPDTNSIASHANHVWQALAWANAEARGETTDGDWEATWLTQSVDKRAWSDLRAALEREYRELRGHCAGSKPPTDTDETIEALVVPAHVLYHLGAIRQIMKSARAVRSELQG